jgi:hypothetical protein
MRSKTKPHATPLREAAPPGDEKMYKIVEEVDRFFKSVHADVEDWKFSMEDFGDGTRVFVRFQIHFDQSVGSRHSDSPKPASSSRAEPADPSKSLALRADASGSDVGSATVVVHAAGGASASRRAEEDLASFVNLWRHKRESRLHGEYHKQGAPQLDVRAEVGGHA